MRTEKLLRWKKFFWDGGLWSFGLDNFKEPFIKNNMD